MSPPNREKGKQTSQHPLKILEFDGGQSGRSDYSQISILKEMAHRHERKVHNDESSSDTSEEDSEPKEFFLSDHFDLIGGVGIGGIIAILAGSFKMPFSKISIFYRKMHEKLFSQPRWNAPNCNVIANAEEVLHLIRQLLPQENLDGPLIDRKRACRAFCCAVNPSNVKHPRVIANYISKCSPIRCTILDAIRTSLADNVHTPPFPLMDPPQLFLGNGHCFSCPISSALKEAEAIYGASRPVGCIVSIGTGRSGPLHNNDARGIIQSCERTAHHWSSLCASMDGLLSRFNVGNGLDSIDQLSLGEIATHTENYLLDEEISNLLDGVVDHLNVQASDVEIQHLLSLSERNVIPQTIQKVLKNQQDDRLSEIQQWLSPSYSITNQLDEIRGARGKYSGEWFLNTEIFVSWWGSDAPLFVLEGVPGSGKTYFTQLIHDTIVAKNVDDAEVKLYGYFIKYKETKTVRDVVSALLAQAIEHSGHVSNDLRSSYQIKTRPTLEHLLDALKEIINVDRTTFIVLDALDEFPFDDRKTLMSTLLSLSSNVRIFVTSRPLPHEVYRTHLHSMQESSNEDILSYVRGCLHPESNHPVTSLLSSGSDLHDKIVKTVMARCSNIFLIANFHMERICKCRTQLEINETLGSLPTTSDEMYSQAIDRIKNLGGKDAIRPLHALMWIFYNAYFLRFKVDELCNAVASSSEDVAGKCVAEARVNGHTLLGLCGGLIVVNSSGEIDFVHLTTREFIESHQATIFPHDPHSQLACACLKFGLALDTVDTKLPFIIHANEQWITYARKAKLRQSPEFALLPLLAAIHKKGIVSYFQEGLLHESTPLPHILVYLGITSHLRAYPIDDTDSKGRTFLHYASSVNLVNTVVTLLAEGATPDPHDRHNRTPLSYASEGVCYDVMQLLLAEGADPNCEDNDYYYSPLSYAVLRGKRESVRLLLAHEGVDPDSRDKNNRSPLSHAAECRDVESIRLLLAREGVDPDSRDNNNRSPLSYAACWGGVESVPLLLAHEGVDPDSRDTVNRSPLSYAAFWGNVESIRLLLAHEGVDPDSRDNNNRSPLSYAAFWVNVESIRLLLAREGVDPDSRDNNNRSPLSYASFWGIVESIRLLLAREGVDPDSRDKNNRSPLSHAAQRGNGESIRLLLAREGVDPDSRDNNNRSPLSHAAQEGDVESIRLLLAHEGVDPDSRDKNNCSPLSHAVMEGNHQCITQLLLAHATMHSNSHDRNTHAPLCYAAQMGDFLVVRYLLAHEGADVNTQDRNNSTALSHAAQRGDDTILKLLLAHDKVEPDSRDIANRTPLSHAAQTGDINLVQLLLDHEKVDPESTDTDNRTPLSHAAQWGHYYVIKILLAQTRVHSDSQDNHRRTPLSYAAQRGHYSAVELLLAHGSGVDPDSQDQDSRTPLSHAAQTGDYEIVELKERTLTVMIKTTTHHSSMLPRQRIITLFISFRHMERAPMLDTTYFSSGLITMYLKILINTTDFVVSLELQPPSHSPTGSKSP